MAVIDLFLIQSVSKVTILMGNGFNFAG